MANNNDFELKGFIQIDGDKAIKFLEGIDRALTVLAKKLNTTESKVVNSLNRKKRAVKDYFAESDKLQRREMNNINRYYSKLERNSASYYNKQKSSGSGIDILARNDSDYARNMTAMRKYYSSQEAEANRNAKKQASEQAKITREKERQLRLQQRQNAESSRFLDNLFSVRNALMLITASYMAQFIKDLIEVNNRIIAVDVRFKALAPNMGAASEEMNWIYKRAKELRQPMLDAAEGYSKFYAAAKNTMSKKDMRNVYDSLLQASTVMHIMPHQFKLVSLAVEQMASKGTVSMEELRRQLGEHIPGAFGIAARAMGMSEKKFNQMVKDGKVFSNEFLPKFAKQLKQELGQGLSTALQSSQSKIINMQNAITELQMKLSASGFSEAVGNVADTITKIIQSPKFDKMMQDLGQMSLMLSKDILPILKSIFFLVNIFLGYKIIAWLRLIPGLLLKIRTGVIAIGTAGGGLWGLVASIALMLIEAFGPQLLNIAVHTFGRIRFELDTLIYKFSLIKKSIEEIFSGKKTLGSAIGSKGYFDALNMLPIPPHLKSLGYVAGGLGSNINQIFNIYTKDNPQSIANKIKENTPNSNRNKPTARTVR